MTHELTPIIYRINANNIIEFVNDAWEKFASDNEAPAVAQGAVGTHLWDHIQGQEVVQLYEALTEYIRGTQRPVAFDFRCDSPETRRDMRLEMIPRPNRCVEFRSTLLSKKPHVLPKDLFSLDEKNAKLGKALRMCAWCKSVHLDGRWIDLESAMDEYHPFLDRMPSTITHGICDACISTLTNAIRNER